MVVRSARGDEAELLHELARVTFPLACPPTTTPQSAAAFIAEHLSVDSFRGYLADPAKMLLLCEVDGDAIGYVMFSREQPTEPSLAAVVSLRPAFELSKCYVLPEFHGAGIASALIEAGLTAARNEGFASVWLAVNEHNGRANRFYEKMGFRIVGAKKFLVGDTWEDDHVRLQELTTEPR